MRVRQKYFSSSHRCKRSFVVSNAACMKKSDDKHSILCLVNYIDSSKGWMPFHFCHEAEHESAFKTESQRVKFAELSVAGAAFLA